MYEFLQPMIDRQIQSPLDVANVEFFDPRESMTICY